jgi:hypothetical protein
MASQRARADWLTAAKQCFFLVWLTAATQRYFCRSWVEWLTAETRHFFSCWLVDGLAAYVQWQISVRGRTDRRWRHNAFSWYDRWRQHNATSSGRGWTDRWRRHGTSSLGWSTVWRVTCNGKSACAGGLINSSDTMLFLGKIDGGDTMLLHLAGQWWVGTLATCLVWQTKFWYTEKNNYTNVGIHNDYTLAITVIATIRFYRTEYNRKQ